MTPPDNEAEEGRRYSVFVNGQECQVDRPKLAGFEIRALFGLDPAHELVVEMTDGPDRVLAPDDVLSLDRERPACIYSHPPSSFG